MKIIKKCEKILIKVFGIVLITIAAASVYINAPESLAVIGTFFGIILLIIVFALMIMHVII